MTNGMKSGAGSDPFADDSNDDEVSPADPPEKAEKSVETDDDSSNESNTDSSPDIDGTSLNRDDIPYIMGRNGVKDNRRMVQYFLRPETEDIETEARRAIEEELGTDVYLTDLREALVQVGADNLDEVADELRRWGYRFRED